LDVNVPDGRDWPEEWSSGEVGDRKRAKQKDPDAFAEQWQADQDAWVAQQSQWLAPGGRISVVVGDGKGIDSNASLQTAFKRVGLHTLASATISAQELPRERREPGRRRTEHVLLAEKPVW
jgi:Mg-chelatase subunit ChlI